MSDITKHKWSVGGEVGTLEYEDYGGVDDVCIHSSYIYLNGFCTYQGVSINKDDSIAISKHFYRTLSQFDRLQFINEIIGNVLVKDRIGYIPQSESANHYQGAIKEPELNNEVLKMLEAGCEIPSEMDGSINCFYCDAFLGIGENHEDNCSYVILKQLLKAK